MGMAVEVLEGFVDEGGAELPPRRAGRRQGRGVERRAEELMPSAVAIEPVQGQVPRAGADANLHAESAAPRRQFAAKRRLRVRPVEAVEAEENKAACPGAHVKAFSAGARHQPSRDFDVRGRQPPMLGLVDVVERRGGGSHPRTGGE